MTANIPVSKGLVKNYDTVMYQPPDIQQWIPGYSYFKDDYEAQLTDSGRAYIAAKLNILGYRSVGNRPITANQLYQVFTSLSNIGYTLDANPIGYEAHYEEVTLPVGWIVAVYEINLYKNGSPVVGYNNQNLQISTTVNSYFDTPPEGEWVNVSGRYVTVTPEPYEKQISNLGWNGGAVSSKTFTTTGIVEFSIEPNSVGIYAGVCEQQIAKLDQRYERIQYAIYTHTGLASIYTNNIKRTEDFTFTRDDIFKIVVSNTQVVFYRNGIEIYSEPKESNNITYALDASMYSSGDTIRYFRVRAFNPETDSYSLIQSNTIHNSKLLGFNYSSILGNQSHNCRLVNLCNLNNNSVHSGVLISLNYSSLGSNSSHTGQLINYSSRIESNIVHTCNLLAKNASYILGNTFHNCLLEAGGILPSIPANININHSHNTKIRNVFILPPQVFIIT